MSKQRVASIDWDELAELDALWSVLTKDGGPGDAWDLDEFWSTGEAQISDTINRLSRFGMTLGGTALDFGCGVGRLSRGLAKHFSSTTGVDISTEMVRQAEELNDEVDGLTFQTLGPTGLDEFDEASYDLVHTRLVLQHLHSPREIRATLDGLARLMKPGGFLVCDLVVSAPPKQRLQLRRRAYETLRSVGLETETLVKRGIHPMVTTAVPRGEMTKWVEKNGLRFMSADEGPNAKVFYIIQKPLH